jgi:hypothetical protein
VHGVKRPSFQWYPADWKNNAKLRRCTFAQRGVWVEIIGLMHASDEYGVLRWTLKEIANAIGCKLKDVQELHDKGVLKGANPGERCAAYVFTPNHAGKFGAPVILVAEQDGPIWFSSRMLVDEYKRTARSPKPTIGETPKPTPKPTPKGGIGEGLGDHPTPHHSRARASSSSSSSPSGGSNESSGSETSLPVQIAVALRSVGVKNAHGQHPDILAWVESGVTLEQAKEAARIALEDRKARHPSVGYLIPILEDMRRPGKPLNGSPAPALDWWTDNAGIFAKAEAEGVEIAMRHNGDEMVRDALTTRARLCVKLGEGINERDATLMRLIAEERERTTA